MNYYQCLKFSKRFQLSNWFCQMRLFEANFYLQKGKTNLNAWLEIDRIAQQRIFPYLHYFLRCMKIYLSTMK